MTAAPAARSRQSEASSTALPLARPEHVPASVTATAILTELRSALVQYFGDAGAGTAGGSLAIRYYNPRTGTALLRCARDNARLVWAALAMISHVDAARCRILCKHLAGTSPCSNPLLCTLCPSSASGALVGRADSSALWGGAKG